MNTDLVIAKLDQLQQNLMLQKEIFTAEEVAAYTGLKVRYIHNLVGQRAIPHYKPRGKMLYFKKQEIMDWLLRGKIATNEEAEQEAINSIVLRRK